MEITERAREDHKESPERTERAREGYKESPTSGQN
jgi:hypothetical protein